MFVSVFRFAVIASTLVCATAPAHAETLVDAIVDAYRNSPQLQAQRAQLRALDETVIQAGAPYRLNAGITATLGYNDRLQRSAIDTGFAEFQQRSMGASLSVAQLLSSGGRTAAQLSAAEADVLSGRERLRQAENEILYQVVDAFMAVRRDTELSDIQSRSVKSYERQVSQARAREAEGDLTKTDIAQAEAQLLIIRAALAQTQATLEQSRSRFAALVGHNPGDLAPPPELPGLPISVDAAYDVATQESPLLWQAILAEKASRHRIAAERAERAPSISLQGSYGYVNPLGYQTRDLGRTLSGGVTVSVPLLSRHDAGPLAAGGRARRAVLRHGLQRSWHADGDVYGIGDGRGARRTRRPQPARRCRLAGDPGLFRNALVPALRRRLLSLSGPGALTNHPPQHAVAPDEGVQQRRADVDGDERCQRPAERPVQALRQHHQRRILVPRRGQ
jgi:outer membrane protein